MCAFCSSSLFTNSNWFTFDGDRGINDRLAASVPSSSPNSEEISLNTEETDEVLTGETTGTESLLESASLGNGPVEEAKELAEVANDSDATTVSEKILCTEEDSASHEPETSERPVDAQEGQTGGVAEASSTEGAANEPCSSSEPGNALPESGDTDCCTANSSEPNEIAHESGSPAEVDDEKKYEIATTNE